MANDERRTKRVRQVAPWEDDGRTLQSQSAAADINLLLERFAQTGTFTHVAKSMPTYGDFSNAGDYSSSMQQVKNAERLFMEIPAKVRARFDHDPGKLLEFVSDPENEHEAIELGLVARPENYVKPGGPPVTPPAEPATATPDGSVQGGE